jgi:thimet oligopeptidase
MRRTTTILLAASLLAVGCARTSTTPSKPEPTVTTEPAALPPPQGSKLLTGTIEQFTASCEADMDTARAQVKALTSLDPQSHGQAVLEAYDEVTIALGGSASRASLAREVHPDAKMRDAARDCEQRIDALQVSVAQDPAVYAALSAVDLSTADAATRHWMERTLLEFRRAGVDRDEPTRQKVKALNDELMKLGQLFGRNISEDVRKVELDPKELAGLPEDYVKAHPVGPNGKVTITSNYPDYIPFMRYATSSKAREKVWRMYRQRAHPQNQQVLSDLLTRRHELATLLGYPNWAAYATQTKMTRNEAAAAEFIQKVEQLTVAPARREYQILLARKQQDDPKAKTLEPWDQDYYEDRYKAEQFGFDSQALRPWLEYGQMKKGVMDITAELFGITYVPVKDAPVWHPEVEVYDVVEGQALLGRIYLDMHPRDDKYKHAAQFDLVNGQKGKRHPEGVLVCNFARPGELMTHNEVETFFHEFGHLLHHVFAGRQQWNTISGISTEWDFVETPSMLLQQWPSDPVVLAKFARHYQTAQPISAEMIEQLRASKEFGMGLWVRRQMFLAAVSLEYYRRSPGFQTEAVLRELQARFAPFREEWREGTHFQVSFGHLYGYSAAYYTYMWSMVIAKDLESAFEKAGYMDTETALKYRKAVLEPGGSRPAAELVNDFLGRDYGFEAYRRFVEKQ